MIPPESMRSVLLPPADWPALRKAALLSLTGALIAGTFGILHDQITYTISPEYFTRMKFDQFRHANFGFSPRVFVAEIGFMATWWVGLIAAWFLARVAVPKFESPGKQVVVAMAIIVFIAVLSGTIGYFAGPGLLGNRPGWREALDSFGVTDATAFNRVAGIHLGSYVGAFLGWIAMMAALVMRPGTATTLASPSDAQAHRSSSPSR
ncbi:MAG: hypothetical protein ACRCXD_13270 [Luteolibacter sp.]